MSSLPTRVQDGPATYAQPEAEAYEDYEEDSTWAAGRGEMPAWLVSLGVHAVIIGVFATITMVTPPQFIPEIISEVEYEEVDYKLDSTIVDQIGSDSDVNRLSPSAATAQAQGDSPQRQAEPVIERTIAKVEVPLMDKIVEPNKNELTDVIDRTGTTEEPGGVPGAVDRITMEIAATLKDDKAVVGWVIDRSPSVSQRREEIASRLENVYRQLGMLVPDEQRSLKSAVASFSRGWDMHTKGAIDDYEEVIAAIRSIEPEAGGDENVFTAVREVAGQLSSYRRGSRKREVMLIVVTDEAGSDQLEIDKTIEYLRRRSIRCYVIGNAAPFGRKEVEIPWEYEGEEVTAVLEPGPETFLPELLALPSWSGGINDDFNKMSSGFGPYALTRLCVETGGMYLITEHATGQKFDHATMRNYAPDYSTPKKYVERLAENPAKVALLRTIARFDPAIKNDPVSTALMTTVMKESRLAFAYNQLQNIDVPNLQRNFDGSTDTILRQQITEAQRPSAILLNQLRAIDDELMQGHKSRDEIEEPRWRANYDLAIGRLAALRARTEGYDRALAAMKSAPKSFEKKGNNRWRLVPSREITTGPQSKKLVKLAEEALQTIVDDHPGTPWAVFAERELSQPMGWEWQEYKQVEINTGRRDGMGNEPNVQFANEEQRRRAMMRAQPPAPKKKIKI